MRVIVADVSSMRAKSHVHRPPPLGRAPLHKLLEVLYRGHAQDEAAVGVGDDGKLLLAAGKELLELLERRLHGDDLVRLAAALEAHHGLADLVPGLYPAAVEQRLKLRDGNVADERARVGVDDGQVGVVALKGREEGERDGVRRREGEGGGRIEVFDGGLVWTVSVRLFLVSPPPVQSSGIISDSGNAERESRTPRYLDDHLETKGSASGLGSGM